MNRLSNDQISALCMELALMLHAGISTDDGLRLMLEDEKAAGRSVVKTLADAMDDGKPLAKAMAESGAFPPYAAGLVEVGTRTGRLEEALSALSAYYDNRARLETQVRGALLYPAMLFLLMLVVVAVLLAKVLPVFDQVFRSLGGTMTGVAGGLLQLGRWLDGALPVLCAVLALSMGLRSGLPMEEALELAGSLLEDAPAAQQRCHDCRVRLEDGAPLADAMRQTRILPAAYCRMLALGARSGSADTVMEEVARRLSEESEAELQAQVNRVEPALTVAGSLLVGVILLSAMLPLLNVLSAVG